MDKTDDVDWFKFKLLSPPSAGDQFTFASLSPRDGFIAELRDEGGQLIQRSDADGRISLTGLTAIVADVAPPRFQFTSSVTFKLKVDGSADGFFVTIDKNATNGLDGTAPNQTLSDLVADLNQALQPALESRSCSPNHRPGRGR